MDKPTIKLNYRVAEKRPRSRRIFWTSLALLTIPFIMADSALLMLLAAISAFGAGLPAPWLNPWFILLWALVVSGFTFGVVGLIKTMRNRQKYALTDAIVAIVLTGLALILLPVSLILFA